MAHERYDQTDPSTEEGRKGGAMYAAAGAVPAVQPYAMNWGLGGAAGFVATVAITLMMYFVPPLMGMKPMDIATMLGTMILPQGGPAAWWSGMVWHFGNGILFTLAYAGALLALRKQSDWRTGAWFGVVQTFLALAVIMPGLMSIHPLVRTGQMMNPGFFLLGMGMGWMPAIFDLVAHLVYGIVAGLIYKHQVRLPGS